MGTFTTESTTANPVYLGAESQLDEQWLSTTSQPVFAHRHFARIVKRRAGLAVVSVATVTVSPWVLLTLN